MNKVITINLAGRAYQLEEAAYDSLRAYLEDARAKLAHDPSRQEIITDLESAIAEKCGRYLSAHKNVVTAAEVAAIIVEMGPVNGESNMASTAGETGGKKSDEAASGPKRLYLDREGAVFMGVASGLAKYFDVDVTLVRLLFIVLTFVTGGAWILLYVIAGILIPHENAPDWSAQDIVDRAKERIEEGAARLSDKSEWRKWKREWKNEWKKNYKYEHQYAGYKSPNASYSYNHSPRNSTTGMIIAALGLLWLLALYTLVSQGTLFGIAIPAGIPIWIAIIVLFVAYHAITGPFKDINHGMEGPHSPWQALEGVMSVIFIIIAFAYAFTHIAQFHDFILNTPHYGRDLAAWIKSIFKH